MSEHDKVYSGEYFATNWPRWHWICTTCKATGADAMSPNLAMIELHAQPAGRIRPAVKATPSGEPNT